MLKGVDLENNCWRAHVCGRNSCHVAERMLGRVQLGAVEPRGSNGAAESAQQSIRVATERHQSLWDLLVQRDG